MDVLLAFILTCAITKINCYSQADLDNIAYLSSLQNDPRIHGKDPPQRVAVVGGGISGTSSVYFLRHLFGDEVKIDLYESEDILCGRIATVEIGGRLYESGGAILHAKNLYAKEVAKKFGLKNAESISTYACFFDGISCVLQTSQWFVITLFRMIWEFGLDFFRLMHLENQYINKFLSIYDLHKKGQSYASVRDLLNATGGDQFINSTQITSCKLFRNHDIGENTIQNLVSAGIKGNYGQNCSVNGFVGMVSMAGIQPNLWSVKGGNKLLCEYLYKDSKCSLLKEKVVRVIQSFDGKFGVTTVTRKEARWYDIVIIATPINRDKSHIDVSEAFNGTGRMPSPTTDPRHFRQTIATFVKGKLNQKLFQCDSLSSCPGALFTTTNLFYRTIGLHVPVDYNPRKDDTLDDSVYKVFSTESLTENQLVQLFENRSELKEVIWKAYPYYSPPDALDTFILNSNGLYYTSPIEWAASAIETSLISAKNAALLAFNNWFGIKENINHVPSFFELHNEL